MPGELLRRQRLPAVEVRRERLRQLELRRKRLRGERLRRIDVRHQPVRRLGLRGERLLGERLPELFHRGDARGLAPRMTRAGELSLLVAISLILGRLGPIDPAARDIAIVLAMAAWIAAAARQAPELGTKLPAGRWAAWIPALAAVAVLLRLDDPLAR